jgi:hypothetical protein
MSAMTCDHSGTHSGASRYLREAGVLRLVLLCDRCGAERRELGRVEYRLDVNVPGRGSVSGTPRIVTTPETAATPTPETAATPI